jgi:hypothetical protein
VKVNYTLFNDETHSFSYSITVETLAVLTKMWIYVTFKVPKNENDQNFQTVLVKTVIDVEKAVKGFQNNFLISMLVENYLKSSDHEIKFPMQKVISIRIQEQD